MTFDQTFRIYEIFNFYFKNEADAKALTLEIESLVRGKITSEKAELATKNDIVEIKGEIRQLEIKMEQGFKDVLKWMIALMVGFGSLILTFAKIL